MAVRFGHSARGVAGRAGAEPGQLPRHGSAQQQAAGRGGAEAGRGEKPETLGAHEVPATCVGHRHLPVDERGDLLAQRPPEDLAEQHRHYRGRRPAGHGQRTSAAARPAGADAGPAGHADGGVPADGRTDAAADGADADQHRRAAEHGGTEDCRCLPHRHPQHLRRLGAGDAAPVPRRLAHRPQPHGRHQRGDDGELGRRPPSGCALCHRPGLLAGGVAEV